MNHTRQPQQTDETNLIGMVADLLEVHVSRLEVGERFLPQGLVIGIFAASADSGDSVGLQRLQAVRRLLDVEEAQLVGDVAELPDVAGVRVLLVPVLLRRLPAALVVVELVVVVASVRRPLTNAAAAVVVVGQLPLLHRDVVPFDDLLEAPVAGGESVAVNVAVAIAVGEFRHPTVLFTSCEYKKKKTQKRHVSLSGVF